MDEIIVTNGQTNPFYTEKVRLTNMAYSHNDCGGEHVEIVEDGEPFFGPKRVLIVDEGEDKAVYVTNPGDLPFSIKVKLYGLPPCPYDHYRIREKSGAIFCPHCGATFTEVELAEDNKGMLWPPAIAS